jgi:ABC-type proline/glycine betaine transport system permease subunit
MNNSTLLTADRATHLKIVVVALTCATLIGTVGLAARLNAAGKQVETTVIKAAKPLTAATGDNRTIR